MIKHLRKPLTWKTDPNKQGKKELEGNRDNKYTVEKRWGWGTTVHLSHSLGNVATMDDSKKLLETKNIIV